MSAPQHGGGRLRLCSRGSRESVRIGDVLREGTIGRGGRGRAASGDARLALVERADTDQDGVPDVYEDDEPPVAPTEPGPGSRRLP